MLEVQQRIFQFLQKDADPGLPEVEDERKKLAGLRGRLINRERQRYGIR